MRILVSGTSGLIGSRLVLTLEANRAHEVYRLVRRPAGSNREIVWDSRLQAHQVRGFDAVIHLAGETIMGRWTASKKARILQSRTTTTSQLAQALATADIRPRSFLVASAIGYYGAQGTDVLMEDSPPGQGFLSQVCQQWEASAEPARRAGIRVAHLRFGMVLTPEGGALRTMLLPFRLGLGGRVGSGEQWMSWMALDDVVAAIVFTLGAESLAGPVNIVTPNPVTNAEFTRALGRALHRPTLFPLPAAVVKVILGEMGQALLLSSQRAVPSKLESSGHRFLHPELDEALRSMFL